MQTAAPIFTHQQINNLYAYGLEIPVEKMTEILALPRETLIADLEKVLIDAVDRYPYFSKKFFEPSKAYFPLHAIYFLGQLKAEASLSQVLDFLENDKDVLHYWLGYHLTETVWLPIYLIAQHKLDLLAAFLLKPGIDTYSKAAVTTVLAQIVLHEPDKRNEVVHIFKTVLDYNNKAAVADNIIDDEFLGLLTGDLIDCGLVELLPLVKKLFDKNRISTGINGNYEAVVRECNNVIPSDYKKAIVDIFELYESLQKNWLGNTDNKSITDLGMQQPTVSNKIGRNEPCPCGSGKKYKKCCIKEVAVQ